MNYWVAFFPFLMYLASLGMTSDPPLTYSELTSLIVTGITLVSQNSRPGGGIWTPSAFKFGYPYLLVSLSLNVLLTLMIVMRLALYKRTIKNILGTTAGTNGLFKAIIAMLVESFALYTVTYLLFIGTWGGKSYLVYTFFPILTETQVRRVPLFVLAP
jgi:hypothetical protein